MSKDKIIPVALDYILMTIGTLIYCMGWTSLLIPNGLASGGLTGFCTILQYGTGIPIGWSFPIINAFLLLLATLVLGKSFGFKTIYVIALSSLLFEVLPKFPALEVTTIPDLFLVALVGGALEAVGIGITLLRGGSTGGSDIIAMIINKYWPVSPGKVYMIMDIFIVALMLLVPGMGIVDMIYGYVIMITFSIGVDYVLLGNKSTVQILVFSNRYNEIADHVINNLHRGVTALQSVGWYSQKESKVLLIVSRKHQMNEVIKEIKSIDPKAFVSVSTAMSVYGEGFEEVKTGYKKDKKKEE
jgi:uncharacterized membrane-anchored protein YitT (DUF2179 family)